MGTSNPEINAPFVWIPIRSLSSRHRSRILAHLLALTESDRYLRFGYHASDAQIGLYVDRLDFDRDEVFGVFNRRLALIAIAHLAYGPEPAPGATALQASRSREAEFGVSVAARARGRGYGARLFDHAVLHARNRGVDTLIIHALSENVTMLRIAHRAGATLDREGGDTEARLKLPPDSLATRVDQVLQAQAAEWDYQLKSGAMQLEALKDLFAKK